MTCIHDTFTFVGLSVGVGVGVGGADAVGGAAIVGAGAGAGAGACRCWRSCWRCIGTIADALGHPDSMGLVSVTRFGLVWVWSGQGALRRVCMVLSSLLSALQVSLPEIW